MAGSYSSLNFDGPMRSDANHAGNPQYAPNSFVHKFRPDTAESPYKVSDNIVSRKSHYYHEGKETEYTQARELYNRVMTSQQRENLHINTANMLRFVTEKVIKVGYLSQVYNIDAKYANAIYNLLPEETRDFTFEEVKTKAKDAHVAGKEAKFRPSQQHERLVGMVPEAEVYNV